MTRAERLRVMAFFCEGMPEDDLDPNDPTNQDETAALNGDDLGAIRDRMNTYGPFDYANACYTEMCNRIVACGLREGPAGRAGRRASLVGMLRKQFRLAGMAATLPDTPEEFLLGLAQKIATSREAIRKLDPQ